MAAEYGTLMEDTEGGKTKYWEGWNPSKQ